MAVVNKLADNMPDLEAAKPGKRAVVESHGVLRTSRFVASIASGDSATSTWVVARVPSDASLDKRSRIRTAGVAGLTDVDFGAATDADVLVDGANLSAAADVDGVSALTLGALSQPLWSQLGLTKDPRGEIDLILTLNTAATASGTVLVDLVYIDK